MKKILLALVLILVIAGIGSPIFSGMMMERVVKNAVDTINSTHGDTGSDIRLSIVQYDRNFLSSKIQWKIGLGSLGRIYGIDNIVLIERARHGILGITSKTSLEKNKWFSRFIENQLKGKNPLDIQTRYEVLGNITSTLTLEGFSIKKGAGLVDILPAHLFIQSDKKVKNFIFKGNWEGMTAPGKIKLAGVSLDSTQNKISPYIWQGKTSISAEHISLDDGQKHMEITGATSDTTISYDKKENSISLGMAYGIASIKSQENTIEDAFVRLGINRIDAQGYEDLVKIYSREANHIMKNIARSQQPPDDMPGHIKEMMGRQMGRIAPQLIAACEKLLKKGFEIKIADLKARLPQGEIKGDISLSLNQDMTMVQFIPIAMQPAAALELFSFKSDICIPHGLTGDNPNLLSPVYPGMQTGLFLKKEDNLIHSAKTRDGKLFVNGQEVLFN